MEKKCSVFGHTMIDVSLFTLYTSVVVSAHSGSLKAFPSILDMKAATHAMSSSSPTGTSIDGGLASLPRMAGISGSRKKRRLFTGLPSEMK